MKTRLDLVKGWIRKAESDLTNASLCIKHGEALDTVCFHAQQAAEKYLKAYLICNEMDFPFVHNLEVLLKICSEKDNSFTDLLDDVVELTPFAVAMRYDDEFWPTAEESADALHTAGKVKIFVLEKIDI